MFGFESGSAETAQLDGIHALSNVQTNKAECFRVTNEQCNQRDSTKNVSLPL